MHESDKPEDLLRYDILTQEALLGVIRRILDEVSKSGLPGDHHFFITFDTRSPAVQLSDRMRERYPEEMTIVIQHTFWNLKVQDRHFEIDLSFDDVRERLSIPFTAVKGFFDPSVKFGLQFDLPAQEEVAPTEDSAVTVLEPEPQNRKVPVKGQSKALGPVKKPGKSGKSKSKKKTEASVEPKPDTGEETATADVVSLDAFRKKK